MDAIVAAACLLEAATDFGSWNMPWTAKSEVPLYLFFHHQHFFERWARDFFYIRGLLHVGYSHRVRAAVRDNEAGGVSKLQAFPWRFTISELLVAFCGIFVGNAYVEKATRSTVEGELGVADFLVNFFKDCGVTVACGLCGFASYTCSREVLKEVIPNRSRTGCFPHCQSLPSCPKGTRSLRSSHPSSSSSIPIRVSAFASTIIMAPQLNAAQRILIKTLLTQGFKTANSLKASYTVRTIQRIRLERQQSEIPTRRTARVGRRGYIISPIQKALYNILIERPYLYRYEMADFLYRNFGKRISEKSIGRTLRSIGWTRKTIRCIAQQRDADLRDRYCVLRLIT
jgi:hypothetical protein